MLVTGKTLNFFINFPPNIFQLIHQIRKVQNIGQLHEKCDKFIILVKNCENLKSYGSNTCPHQIILVVVKFWCLLEKTVNYWFFLRVQI